MLKIIPYRSIGILDLKIKKAINRRSKKYLNCNVLNMVRSNPFFQFKFVLFKHVLMGFFLYFHQLTVNMFMIKLSGDWI